MARHTRPKSFFEKLYYVVFAASREGRPSEIAAWSNALASIAVGAGVYVITRSSFAIALPVIVFLMLRATLAHRSTVWLAASMGTLAVASLGGSLSWLFAHVIERPWAPSVAAVFGAIVSAMVPAWAYAKLAERRADNVPDSLVDPVSIPPSRD